MLLGTLASLQWYGPGCGAGLSDDQALADSAPIKGYGNGQANTTVSIYESGHVTGLKNSISNSYGSSSAQSDVLGRAKALSTVLIGATPSAFDITQSILNAAATSYNISGSVGGKINSGGGGSDSTLVRGDELAMGGNNRYLLLNLAASSIDRAYENMRIYIVSGTGEGQIRRIKNYDGAYKKAFVEKGWMTSPDNTSVYRIIL